MAQEGLKKGGKAPFAPNLLTVLLGVALNHKSITLAKLILVIQKVMFSCIWYVDNNFFNGMILCYELGDVLALSVQPISRFMD